MSLSTTIRSPEEMIATRDMLRGELATLDQQTVMLTDEINRIRQDQHRIRHLLTSIEAALAEAGSGSA